MLDGLTLVVSQIGIRRPSELVPLDAKAPAEKEEGGAAKPPRTAPPRPMLKSREFVDELNGRASRSWHLLDLLVGNVEALARERGPLYEEVAHVIIETGRPNVQSVVQNILVHLERREAAEPSSSPALPESPAPTEPPTPQHP